MEFKLVGCYYHRGYPALPQCLTTAPLSHGSLKLLTEPSYEPGQETGSDFNKPFSPPPFGCMLDSQVLILAQRLGLEGVLGDR